MCRVPTLNADNPILCTSNLLNYNHPAVCQLMRIIAPKHICKRSRAALDHDV